MNFVEVKNFLIKGTPPIKLKSKLLIRPSPNYQARVNATSDFEFKVDISILATVSEELATLRKPKIDLH